jgi:hypothetical protein
VVADRRDRRHHRRPCLEARGHRSHEVACRYRAAVRRALGVERVAELFEAELSALEA